MGLLIDKKQEHKRLLLTERKLDDNAPYLIIWKITETPTSRDWSFESLVQEGQYTC
jgi:hypothetical protein